MGQCQWPIDPRRNHCAVVCNFKCRLRNCSLTKLGLYHSCRLCCQDRERGCLVPPRHAPFIVPYVTAGWYSAMAMGHERWPISIPAPTVENMQCRTSTVCGVYQLLAVLVAIDIGQFFFVKSTNNDGENTNKLQQTVDETSTDWERNSNDNVVCTTDAVTWQHTVAMPMSTPLTSNTHDGAQNRTFVAYM